MLIPSYFIVNFEEYDNVPDVILPVNAYLSYRITPNSIHSIDSFYQKMFLSARENLFCLLLQMDHISNLLEEKNESMVDLLISFTFHKRYIKVNGNNPLLLIKINNPSETTYVAGIVSAFKKHGYDTVEVKLISNNSTAFQNIVGQNTYFNLTEGDGKLSLAYTDSIKQVSSRD